MCHKLVALLALLAGPVAGLAALAPSAACQPPALAGPGSVIAMHVQLFRAIDAGDAAVAASFVGPHAETSLFLPRDGEPVAIEGRDEVAAQLAEWARASADGTHETAIEPISSDCHSGDLSYAVLRIERTTRTAEGPLVERFLSTSLVQYRDGGWKLRHWHLSAAD